MGQESNQILRSVFMSVQSIIQLLGGVGLFLFAIKLISEALQLIAGDRLRQLIGTLTKTPIMGVLVGACVTVLIQSSSATTVMTVSFVDAGLMTLTQAIGVIMGANIGPDHGPDPRHQSPRLRLPLHYYRRASLLLRTLQGTEVRRQRPLGFWSAFRGNADHGILHEFPPE